MLSVKELTYQYNKDTLLEFPDFDLNSNESLLLLGPSGSGKSTLLHLLGGLLTIQNGGIELDGTSLSTLKGKSLDKFRGENIGIVFQQHHFIRSLTLQDNLKMASYLAGNTIGQNEIETITDAMEVSHLLAKKSYEVSIGQLQRMAIARALINQPKLLLADEPTSALDNSNSHKVIELLQQSADRSGAHLVVVTHDTRLKDRFQKRIEL